MEGIALTPRPTVVSRLRLPSMFIICLVAAPVSAQDTARVRVPGSDSSAADSVRKGRVDRARDGVLSLARRSLLVARRGERVVFGVDSAVEKWTLRNDPTNTALRKLSPIAFWIPAVVVASTPLVWADEAQDGNRLNAQYARGATAALGLGFIASRTTKHFIHRARPCTGATPDDVFVSSPADSMAQCPRRSGVASYTSFFSEHTMALFAIASAATFQAQRQQAPNATKLAVLSFGAASVFSIGRIYQQHHWLSDVLVGAAVGTASGFVAAQIGPGKPRN